MRQVPSRIRPTGFRIFRAEEGGSFSLAADFPSLHPRFTGDTALWDSQAVANKWYFYKAEPYGDTAIAASPPDTTFGFEPTLFKLRPGLWIKDTLARFPAHYKNWSMRVGDTLLMGETALPDTGYSIIDISQPAKPVFKGSGAFPAWMAARAQQFFAWGDNLLIRRSGDTSLVHLRFHAGGFALAGVSKDKVTKILASLDDSTSQIPTPIASRVGRFPGRPAWFDDGSRIWISPPAEGAWTLRLADISGRILWVSPAYGRTAAPAPRGKASGLAPGVYFLSLHSPRGASAVKIVLDRSFRPDQIRLR